MLKLPWTLIFNVSKWFYCMLWDILLQWTGAITLKPYHLTRYNPLRACQLLALGSGCSLVSFLISLPPINLACLLLLIPDWITGWGSHFFHLHTFTYICFYNLKIYLCRSAISLANWTLSTRTTLPRPLRCKDHSGLREWQKLSQLHFEEMIPQKYFL